MDAPAGEKQTGSEQQHTQRGVVAPVWRSVAWRYRDGTTTAFAQCLIGGQPAINQRKRCCGCGESRPP